ncbi:CheR family methyltransferase [Tahibacter sp.]|uniref:CheR family methyltransferase n=1 Tax=Tahibacter sp. TaxID=2056211 RepID=UPI0028C3C747|nr:CheR family methyltransferase [Tahibacter sp.]
MSEERAGTAEDEPSASWRVAVLGASAGGIDALKRTLAGLPERPQFVTVVIPHLDPTHESVLTEILQKATPLPLRALVHGERLEDATVYVLSPGEVAGVHERCAQIAARPPGANHAIDRFLESAAAQDDVCVAAVVLSGIGSDGVAGAAAVKLDGGLVIAQAPQSAEHDGMPQALIEEGLADEILVPEEIGAVLERFFGPGDVATPPHDEAALIAEALALVQTQLGLDLRYYKDANVRRRLLRRAFLRSRGDLSAYLGVLRDDVGELSTFRDDLLIGVTAFFRDQEFVVALEQHIFPDLLDRTADAIRIWVPACSTGEEAYSIAILLHHTLQVAGISRKVQIFGSDINERAIQHARAGCYDATALASVPEYLRSRYFVRDDKGWRIAKPVREMCVFAAHDVFSNAPFSNVDLVSARNFLIYLRKSAKRQAFDVFFYALRRGGHLLLGPSETADAELFEDREPALSLYRRRQITRPPVRGFSFTELPTSAVAAPTDGTQASLESLVDRLALARYAPPGFVVDANGRVVQFRGDTAHLLQPTSGDAALSLARLVRAELQVDVRAALMEAVRGKLPVRRERVRLGDQHCTLDVVPIPAGGTERYFLVSVQACATRDAEPPAASSSDARNEDLERYVRVLGDELEQTRAQLRNLVAEYDATSEALRTANEEILSANEELQSANEELKEAKRDLEQANTHLTSLNEELRQGNEQLVALNDDLSNLIRGIPVPVLMLDREQNVRHFSPAAAELFGLTEASAGSCLAAGMFPGAVLDSAFNEALQELRPVEREVQDHHGSWFILWARAYQTSESRIEGAVLAFQDIHHLKIALDVANRARAESERANAAKNDFLALVSHELRAPLNVIANWLQVLRVIGVTNADPKVALGVDAIDRSCKTQAQLINDLLDISRITSGSLVLDLRPTDIAAVVRALTDALAPRAAEAGKTVASSGLSLPIMVTGDIRRLQQIVSNLLENAVKFTPAGGHVDVSLARVGNYVELSVSDTGIGIAEDELPRIFDRFSQRDISKTREFGGLGLGLSIVRNLTDAHGGSVIASSAGLGRGARFVVRLPLTPLTLQEARGGSQSSPAPASSLAGVRILVVDDEACGRDALGMLFTALEATVTTACDAFEALEHLSHDLFDVMVADIAMPRMDGYQLVRELRQREALTQAPPLYVVALTGFSSLGERDEALSAGFDAHFGKPANIDEIVLNIESGLRQRAAMNGRRITATRTADPGEGLG